MLSEPLPVERERLEEERRAAEQTAQPAPDGASASPAEPPIPSGELVGLNQDLQRADEFRAQRLAREVQDLARTLLLERQRLDEERARLDEAKTEFERTRAEIAALEGDAQFKAALSVLRQVKPAEAKQMLQAVIEGIPGSIPAPASPGLSGMEQAVAYLDALGSMERGEIMSQFVKDSPAVAAELLERLRTFGLVADASGEQGP
jgi:hypothetical protein